MNSGTQRSASIHRAGTREVHNKLEKNRRAHLKECFEQLKRQLPQMQEEKKTSNLLILSNASKYISVSIAYTIDMHKLKKICKNKTKKIQIGFILSNPI